MTKYAFATEVQEAGRGLLRVRPGANNDSVFADNANGKAVLVRKIRTKTGVKYAVFGFMDGEKENTWHRIGTEYTQKFHRVYRTVQVSKYLTRAMVQQALQF